jgi:hypothetical protein
LGSGGRGRAIPSFARQLTSGDHVRRERELRRALELFVEIGAIGHAERVSADLAA